MTKALVTVWEWFLAGIGIGIGFAVAGALLRGLGAFFTWIGHRVS